MNISKRIIELRLKKGLKQSDMAELLDLSQSSYSRIENNADNLTIKQLEKIANALGISIKELMFGSEEDMFETMTMWRNRAGDLEERMGEKNDLIVRLRRDIEHVESTFQDYMYYFELEFCDKYDIKIIHVKNGSSESKVTIKEFLSFPPEVRLETVSGEEGFLGGLNDNEIRLMYKELFQSEKYGRMMMLIADCEVLENEELRKARHKYGNYDFTKLSFRLMNPLHDKKS